MYNSRKSQFTVMIVLSMLAAISVSKDGGGVIDLIGIIIWCTWAPLIAVFLLRNSFQTKSLYRYSVFGVFVATSLFSFITLTIISFQTLVHGPLNESGMMFMIFPIGFVNFGVVGAVIGAVVHWINNRRRNA